MITFLARSGGIEIHKIDCAHWELCTAQSVLIDIKSEEIPVHVHYLATSLFHS